MSIDIHNYEEFLLDRFEGRLSADREKELDAFLRSHPEIARQVEEFEMISLPADDSTSSDFPKDILKKNIRPTSGISSDNYEMEMIMSVEGLLNGTREEELREFLRMNPALEHDLRLFRAARLKADAPAAFPAKDRLYKKRAGLILFRPAMTGIAAASVLLLALAIRFIYINGEVNAPAIRPDSNLPVAATVSSPEINVTAEKTAPVLQISPANAAELKHDPAPVSKMSRQASFRPEPSYTAALLPEAGVTGLSIIYDRRKLRISAFTEHQEPFLARAIGNFAGRIGGNLRENLGVDKADRDNFDFWSVAAAGVKSFGTMTDRNLELYLDKDEEGKVTSYALLDDERRILARSRPQE